MSAYLQTDIGMKIQNKLYEKLLKVRLMDLQGSNSIEITNALIEDTEFVSNNLVVPTMRIFSAVVSFVIALFFMLSISWQLTLIVLPFGLITSITARVIHKKSMDNINEKRNKSSELWKIFTEGIRGIIPIRIYRYDDKYSDIVKNGSAQMKKVSLAQEKLSAMSMFFVTFLFMMTIGIILIFSGIFVVQGIMTIGALTAVLMFNHMLVDPLIDILNIQSDVIKLNVSLKRISKLFAFPDDENISKEIVSVDKVSFENMSFSYSDGSVVYENVNLDIQSPCNIWIKGDSGVGKTTLANIIAGLYQPTSGRIKYFNGGKEVDGIPRVSYLIQDGYLFDKSIYDNIKVANPSISGEEIAKIIEIASLEDVLAVHGDSPIGENGSYLSGGEKKRLRIAQMLANDTADILIIDELTSSLDEELGLRIMRRIFELKLDKICLFVEHNSKVAEFFEQGIVVKGHGVVVE